MTKRSLIQLAGVIWLIIGLFLLSLGMKFLLSVLHNPSPTYFSSNFSFLKLFSSTPYQTVMMWIIVVALGVGYMKGRFVFRRSVTRQVKRIEALEKPGLKDLYSKGYYFLMGGMIALGISLRFLPISLDLRGGVDIVIGSALLQGALHFFRSAPPATNRVAS